MMGNIQAIEVEIPYEVVQYWGWFLVFGIGLLALGILLGQVGVGHRRHDVVLRMALGVGLRHRDRAGGLGGALGAIGQLGANLSFPFMAAALSGHAEVTSQCPLSLDERSRRGSHRGYCSRPTSV
jgi:hypothetical protein